MTAENTEFKMTYLDLQAYAGVTKHMGGLEATNELLSLCHIKNAQQVLDVGCGIGIGPAYMAKTYGCRVVGVDISEKMVEWSRQRAKQEGVEDYVELRTADVLDLPFEADRFDVVICESVLAFIENKPRAIRELVRVVKPDGYVGLNEALWIEQPPPERTAQALEWGTEILTADGCLWETGRKDESERPTLSLGLKGIIYLELQAHGAKSDLHSSMATLVPNPAWRLVWALSTLKDEDDNILVDGLMDHVAEPTAAEMDMLAAIPFEEEKMRANLGISRFVRGLTGVQALKKHLYEPTCTICGFKSGYIGEGAKTVLPNTAMVKLDFRLVPNLEPDLVVELLRQHLDKRGFTDIEVVPITGLHPAKASRDAPLVKAAVAAAQAVYGQEPVVYPLMAGSGPMYPLTQALGIPALAAGVGHSNSNLHAPNENIRLEDYFQGIRFVGELIRRFAAG